VCILMDIAVRIESGSSFLATIIWNLYPLKSRQYIRMDNI